MDRSTLRQRWAALELEDKIAFVAVAQWPFTILIGMALYWTGVVR